MHSYNVPRGGLLVSGRGYMPGFFEGRNGLFLVKRVGLNNNENLVPINAKLNKSLVFHFSLIHFKSAPFERDGEPEEIPEESPENTRRIPQIPRIYRFQRYADLD